MYRAISWFAAVLMGLSAAGPAIAADDASSCAKAAGDDAIAACDRVLAGNPDDLTAYIFRGSAYQRKGDLDHAIADFDEAIKRKPGIFPASVVPVYILRAAAYHAKGDLDRAIADYDQAIKSDSGFLAFILRPILGPMFATAHYDRGNVYEEKGDHDHAIADYDEVIRRTPDSGGACRSRGNAYFHKGDYDHAVADYDQVIRLNPNDARASFNRGAIYEWKGDLNRAIADYDQALTLNPNFDEARESRERARAALGQPVSPPDSR